MVLSKMGSCRNTAWNLCNSHEVFHAKVNGRLATNPLTRLHPFYYPLEVRRGEYWGLGIFLSQYFPLVKI